MSLNNINLRLFHEEKDNENLWRFLTKISCYTGLAGLFQTSYNSKASYNKNLEIYPDETMIILAEKGEIIGVINFVTKKIEIKDKVEKTGFLFGLKIDPFYAKKGVEKVFLKKILEIIDHKKLSISNFYCLIREYEKTSLNYYIGLGFQKEKKFYCVMESIEIIKKFNINNQIKHKNKEFSLKKIRDKQKIEQLIKTSNNENIMNFEEIFNSKEYLGFFFETNEEESIFFGLNLWRKSNENQAQVTRFILPVNYFFSKWALPVLLLMLSSIFAIIFKWFKEEYPILFILFVGVLMGIMFAFLKVRRLLFAKTRPIIYLFCPFYHGGDEEKREYLFRCLLEGIYSFCQQENYFYFKLILPQNPQIENILSKFPNTNDNSYCIDRLIYKITEKPNNNDSRPNILKDYIDPRDI